MLGGELGSNKALKSGSTGELLLLVSVADADAAGAMPRHSRQYIPPAKDPNNLVDIGKHCWTLRD